MVFNHLQDLSNQVSSGRDRPPLPSDGPDPEVSVQEKIRVTVRVRPLTPKEAASKDFSAWVCIDDRSIVSRNQEPPIYIFGTT